MGKNESFTISRDDVLHIFQDWIIGNTEKWSSGTTDENKALTSAEYFWDMLAELKKA